MVRGCTIRFIQPGPEHRADVMDFYTEFRTAGQCCIGSAWAGSYDGWLAEMERRRRGQDLPAGFVPEYFYLCYAENTLVGVFSLKLRLTDQLRQFGGHIGYAVRPLLQGRGYATAILGCGLEWARELGFAQVLLVCDAENVASEKVILKQGGRLENCLFDSAEGVWVHRYRIDLPQGGERMDNTKRFSGKGAVYALARPGYAPSLFTCLQQDLQVPPGAVFADVGAGTGIFSRQLLQSGFRVVAVEPNDDMRRQAEQTLNGTAGYQSVNGTADHTGLADESVDWVSAAQAFHWFDPADFRRECCRILRPGGQVLLAYNNRDLQAPCTRALAELWHTYSARFVGFSNGMSDEKCRAFFDDKCRVFRAENSQTYDRQGYIARLLSSSHAPAEDQVEYTDFLAAAGALFDRYQVAGRLTVPMYTVAYMGQVKV